MAIKMSPMKFELDQEAVNTALLAVVTESGVALEGKYTRVTFKRKEGAQVAVIEVSTEPFLETPRDPNAPKRGRKPKSATVAAEVVEPAAEVVAEAELVAEAAPTKPAKKKALFGATEEA
jgi:hypothetical protein